MACHTPPVENKGKCHYPFSVPSHVEFRDQMRLRMVLASGTSLVYWLFLKGGDTD